MAGVATHAVREECLCEDRKRTEGSLGRCTWLTPAAALAVDLLHCRPSGIKQKHCDTFSTLAGSTGSSPASVSPSLSSVIHIHKTHNPISTTESIFWINLLIKKTKKTKHTYQLVDFTLQIIYAVQFSLAASLSCEAVFAASSHIMDKVQLFTSKGMLL